MDTLTDEHVHNRTQDNKIYARICKIGNEKEGRNEDHNDLQIFSKYSLCKQFSG